MPVVKITTDPMGGPSKVALFDDRGNQLPIETEAAAHALARGIIEEAWERIVEATPPANDMTSGPTYP